MTTFVARLLEIAQRHPDAIALQSPTERVTYRDLVARASALGALLRERGAGPERIVGICIEKSPDYVVALVGVWCAGAAFVPIDPKLPAERRALIERECALDLVVTKELLAEAAEIRPPVHPRPEDLAYVIYTSGSTGVPKGVLVEHRGYVNLLDAQIAAFQLDSQSRALLYLSTSFDASLSDIGTALLAGAALCFAPEEALQAGPPLLRTLAAMEITHLDLPPALMRSIDVGALPRSLRTVVIGGEPATPELVRAWARRLRVVNVYGPTEATICTSLCVCDPEAWERPLLGQPIANMGWRVLDSEGRDVPAGEPGELYLSGIGLARGYLQRPELTRARFVAREGERLYRTGDRVVRHADGEVEFLGRVDRQVKLRGLLIEPEEIEAQLRRHPGVAQAAVLKRTVAPGRSMLVAYVVSQVDTAALRSHLAATLPRWMLPQRFERLAAMPRTVSGKIDLDALACLPLEAQTEARVPPSTPQEALLCELWQRVLGLDAVGVTDDFFALGGDSIAVLELVAAADAKGFALTPAMVQRHPTIAELAVESADDGAMSADALLEDLEREIILVPRNRTGSAPVRDRPTSILLTGATGFLGLRLLGELLRHTDARIHCLVRASSEDEGRTRLARTAEAHGIGLDFSRIAIVPGHLERERFGLTEGTWRALADDVDTVVHCAAQVNVVLTYERLREANVGGTREVLQFVAEGRPKRLHDVSTLSVFVATDRNRGLMRESDDLTQTRWIYGGYAQSKWAAERLVRSAALVPTAIYRLGLVTGDTRTGFASPTDLLSLFLRGSARVGCIPEGIDQALRVDVTPVDYAAAALVQLALHYAEPEGLSTFHIANPQSLSLGALVEAMRAFGLQIQTVSFAEWRRRIASLADDGGSLAEAAAFLALCRGLPQGDFERLRTLDLFQATDTDFDLARTTERLARHGLACPAPSPALLRTYLQFTFGRG